jgi:predicted nucleic acid-binding Zn finger protein
MSVIKKKSPKIDKIDKVVFESYKDVINERMSAGKDVTKLTIRLNTLLSKIN